ncbi:hypothetical protein BH11PSE9_BH11PSE9_30490 [soil metagenome]
MMRLLRITAFAIIGLLLTAMALLMLGLQRAPLIAHEARIGVEQIGRAKQIIDAHNPDKAPVAGLRALVLSQGDVDLLVNYTAHRMLQASTQLTLVSGRAILRASVPVRGRGFGDWLNVEAWLQQTDGLPEFEKLRVGRVPVPAFVADFALRRLLIHLDAIDEVGVAGDMIRSVRFEPTTVQVIYEWRPQAAKDMLSALMPKGDHTRLKAYSDRMAALAASLDPTQPVSLEKLLPPMFALAQQRSASGSDAAAENRTAILVLAFFANHIGLYRIAPEADEWQSPPPRTVLLAGREDTPLHFLVSAVIASQAGSPLSNAIGLFKEVDDSRGGSGFSFNDLAADRAGTRFGELAIASPAKLQHLIAAGVREADFMPHAADLPENLPEAEFEARFGGIGGPAYNKVLTDIEARVASVMLYR